MTDPSVDTDGGAVVSGNVNTEGGTFIGRDQNLFVVLTDYTGGDLEKVLPALREALRSGKADFKSDPNRKRLTVAAPAAPTFILSEAAAADLLSSAAHNQSEDDYLAALQVNPRYGRWAAQFVPLAGTLTEVDLPPGWADVPPEFTLLELQGDGPQRQFKRTRLENINQALDQHPACVLLGEPGAGKTTVLRKLALDQAARKLQRGDGPLPIMLTLADYRRFKSPFEFVESAWQKQFGAQPLADRLRGGGLLLLVDSLNEMPFADERDYRQRVADWRNFAGEWPGNCFVFSCRSRDYSEPLNLPQVEIEKLDDERVRDFLQKYLPADLAAVAWERLRSSPLLSLVLNPYYLSMLAYLIHRGGEWPRNRAELFDHFARLLLLREQDRQHPNWPGLDVMQNALSALAESLQPLGQGTRLPRPEFLQRFPAAVRGKDGEVAISPKDVLELGLAANLLDAERPTAEPEEQVRFYHHQVQEYFAARALLARFNAKEDLSARWRQPRLKTEMPHPGPLGDSEPMPPPPTTGWEEPTVLAAALAPQPAALVAAVARLNPALAARCLLDSGRDSEAALADAVRGALLKDLSDLDVHIRSRMQAGDALGKLGDPRFKAVTVEGNRVILPPLVRLPAGRFKMGTGLFAKLRLVFTGFVQAQVEVQRTVSLAEFQLGQYPVTNAEYACFVKAGGYQTEAYWQGEAARAWLRGEEVESGNVKQLMDTWRTFKANPSLLRIGGIPPQQREAFEQLIKLEEAEVREMLSKRYAERPRDKPAFWDDERFNNPARPAVGVNWFEASAYCAWLNEQWHSSAANDVSPLPDSHTVRLPTEAEWEYAARGRRRREYAWGDRWEPDRANTYEERLLTTSPAGAYPAGQTPEGIFDLSGNVGEWTISPFKPGDEARAVRGGSFIDLPRFARCASRYWVVPVGFGGDIGFRVCVSLAVSES